MLDTTKPDVRIVAWVTGKQNDYVFVRVLINNVMTGELMVDPDHADELVRRLENDGR